MKRKNEWVVGFCVALAEVHRLLLGGNDSSGIRAVARDAGLTLAMARQAGVDKYDLEELARAGVQASAEKGSGT